MTWAARSATPEDSVGGELVALNLLGVVGVIVTVIVGAGGIGAAIGAMVGFICRRFGLTADPATYSLAGLVGGTAFGAFGVAVILLLA